jgi:hypothetical protein
LEPDLISDQKAPDNVRKFSLFHELMRKKDLRQRFQDDLQFKQRFHKWLLENRLNDSKQVRALPGILENAEATKALDKAVTRKRRRC